MGGLLSFDWSKMLAFNWGVFWAVLAALAVGYWLFCFLARALPTRNVVAEAWLERIAGDLETLTEKIELSATEGQLNDIEALLEYQVGVSTQSAHKASLERSMEEEDAERKLEESLRSDAEKTKNSNYQE